MFRRLWAIATVSVACLACDVSSSSEAPSPSPVAVVRSSAPSASVPVAASAAPTAAAPPQVPSTVVTNPPAPAPASGARVSVLPSSTGALGSSFLLQLSGFAPGSFMTTITYPNGIPKSQLGQVGPDGRASVTFSTSTQDVAGRYTFRFDAGPTSVTTTVQVTR